MNNQNIRAIFYASLNLEKRNENYRERRFSSLEFFKSINYLKVAIITSFQQFVWSLSLIILINFESSSSLKKYMQKLPILIEYLVFWKNYVYLEFY